MKLVENHAALLTGAMIAVDALNRAVHHGKINHAVAGNDLYNQIGKARMELERLMHMTIENARTSGVEL